MQPKILQLPFHIPLIGDHIQSYGFMVLLAILLSVYVTMKRVIKAKGDPDLILNIGFIALFGGIIGCRLFFVIHYWDTYFAYLDHPLAVALSIRSGGMEFYGGMLTVTACILVYLLWRRLSIRMYLDLITPSLFLGLAIGRLGCFLNGCCWGGICMIDTGEKALPWAVQFPFASPAHSRHWLDMRVTVPAELMTENAGGALRPLPKHCLGVSPEELLGPQRRYEKAKEKYEAAKRNGEDEKKVRQLERKMKYAEKDRDRTAKFYKPLTQVCDTYGLNPSDVDQMAARLSSRSLPVHPAQLYSALAAALLSVFLALLLRVRKRHGIVTAVGLMMYPVQRFVLELVRTDNPRDTFGLSISQAVSVGIFVVGLLILIVVYQLPVRSPRAVAFVPPVTDDEKEPPSASEAVEATT